MPRIHHDLEGDPLLTEAVETVQRTEQAMNETPEAPEDETPEDDPADE